MAIVITSCSHQVEHKKDVKITVWTDTSFTYQEPITAPRYSCDGKLLSEPKLTGMKDVTVPLSLKKDTVISGDSLFAAGSVPASTGHKDSSGLDWLWPIMEFFLGILLFVLMIFLVALAIWGLIQLAKKIFSKSSKKVVATPPAPTAPGVASVTSPTPTEPVPPVPPAPPAGSGPIYYIGHVENLHIHNETPPPSPAKKPVSRGKSSK